MTELVDCASRIPRLDALVAAGVAVVAAIAALTLGRRAAALRLPAGGSVALLGLVWAATYRHRPTVELILLGGLMLAIWWALALLQVAALLLTALVRRARRPWRGEQGGVVDHAGLENRLDREVGRLTQGGQPGLVILAIGTGLRGRWRRKILREAWRRALRTARLQDALYRAEDGSILALLPDTAGWRLERWIEEITGPLPDAVVGRASYPADGRDPGTLLESAMARMWWQMESGAAGVPSPPPLPGPGDRADPSCIPLTEADLIELIPESGARLLEASIPGL